MSDATETRPSVDDAWSVRARATVSTVPQALRLVWSAAPAQFAGNALLTVAQGSVPAIALFISKLIIDTIVAAMATPTPAQIRQVLTYVAIWFGVQALGMLVHVLGQLVGGLQRDMLARHVNVLLMEKASALDLAQLEDSRLHDRLENARREAGYRPIQLLERLFGLLRNVVTLVGVVGVLVALAWWLVLLLAITIAPLLLIHLKFSGQAFALLTQRAPEQRRLAYLSWLFTTDSAFKELRMFGLHGGLLEQYRQIWGKFYRENRSLAVRRSLGESALGLLAVGAEFITYAHVALAAIAGQLTLGGLTVYYQAFQQSRQALAAIVLAVGGFYEDTLFLSNLFAFLSLRPRLPQRPDPLPFPSPISHSIAFEHVSFAYPGSAKWVLRDVSFVIRTGESVAIVGENGAGKTTLVKLLARLYDPVSGRITVDGIDLRDFDPCELRSHLSVVFQDYLHYQATARENIAFGRIDAAGDAARVERAAQAAGVHTMIAALPQGYDTPLGRWFEGGQELSTGQWQKMAIARAFMRDAAVLILDEPTASLDARSEGELFATFTELKAGRMGLFISHRFSTVRLASRIVVLDSGYIVEDGTHDALRLAAGCYARLFATQAASYR